MVEIQVIASSILTLLDLLDRMQNRGFKNPADVEAYNEARNKVRKDLVALLTSKQTPEPVPATERVTGEVLTSANPEESQASA